MLPLSARGVAGYPHYGPPWASLLILEGIPLAAHSEMGARLVSARGQSPHGKAPWKARSPKQARPSPSEARRAELAGLPGSRFREDASSLLEYPGRVVAPADVIEVRGLAPPARQAPGRIS